MNTPARWLGQNFSNKIASLSQHSRQNAIILVLYVFPLLGVCKLALLVKLQESTKQWQSRTIQVIMFLYFPYEHSTEFVPVTGLIWRGPKPNRILNILDGIISEHEDINNRVFLSRNYGRIVARGNLLFLKQYSFKIRTSHFQRQL